MAEGATARCRMLGVGFVELRPRRSTAGARKAAKGEAGLAPRIRIRSTAGDVREGAMGGGREARPT